MPNAFRSYFPVKPKFTEKDILDLEGRVFIITGGTGGVGLELAKILYHANASRIYLLGRSEASGREAIETVTTSRPYSPAANKRNEQLTTDNVRFIRLDLSDLSTIEDTAKEFLRQETRLDVIWHNAAVMLVPDGVVSPQGHELTFATNVLGPFLLQKFLTPVMLSTAQSNSHHLPPLTIRICWAGAGEAVQPPGDDGISWSDLSLTKAPVVNGKESYPTTGFYASTLRYIQSKAANAILATEMAARYPTLGSWAFNPGAIRSGIARNAPTILAWFHWMMGYPVRMGALTEAYVGLAGEEFGMGKEAIGSFIIPFGHVGSTVSKVEEGIKQRGSGKRLWEVCEELVSEYATDT
ncbi:hypothetical protein F5884DRAFT_680880 [Xylogone sp. PMI_703]|nr:hypothetical protein F5884DRAFT_680880 [Xylogone sp. PMI_703]